MATNNATNTSNPITVAQGGTGLATLTNHSVQVGAGTSNVTQLAVGATNSVFVGSTGADPSFSTTSTSYFTGISFDAGTTTLSTYVTSTFTPVITGGGSNPTPTYTSQQGFYVKIGKLVYVQMSVTTSALVGGTGSLQLGALPFNTSTATNYTSQFSALLGTTVVLRTIGFAGTNASIVVFYPTDASASATALPATTLTSLYVAGTYMATS